MMEVWFMRLPIKAKWPLYDKSAITEDVITMVVQVNGKVRSKVEVPFNIKEEELKKIKK